MKVQASALHVDTCSAGISISFDERPGLKNIYNFQVDRDGPTAA